MLAAEEGDDLTAAARFWLGLALLGAGLAAPLGTLLVPLTDWSAEAKIAVGGVLFFGFEIMAVPAAAVMGKDNFEKILARAGRLLGRLKPSGEPGPLRHAVGIVLFVLPFAPTYVMAYAPSWLPDASPWRLWVNLGVSAVIERKRRAARPV
jgi:hypothetical protein